MISFDEALAIVRAHSVASGAETVTLDKAVGRILAEDIVATHRQPPDPRSTMDGIAIAVDGAMPGDSFRLIGEIHAGDDAARITVGEGEAVRVATGAVVPSGATTIVPLENYTVEGGEARIREKSPGSRFIRRAGADFNDGEILLCAGTRLSGATVGLAAAANCGSLMVRRKAKIAILTSGNELIAPGTAMTAGRTIDSASPTIAALCAEWGGEARSVASLGDDPDAIATALGRAMAEVDLIVAIGGASVGERDHLRPVARSLGFDLKFERVRVQPGKPCWFGTRGKMTILGLPGNPASAFVCAHLFLKPLLMAMAHVGGNEIPLRAVFTGRTLASGNRRLFARGRAWVEGSRLMVEAFADQDSGLQRILGRSNALIEVPEDSAISAGNEAVIHLVGPLSARGTPDGSA